MKVFVSYHSNQIYSYKHDYSLKKAEASEPELKKIYGELESHRLPIRGVQISENDGIIATNSFDSVKIWKVDFMA